MLTETQREAILAMRIMTIRTKMAIMTKTYVSGGLLDNFANRSSAGPSFPAHVARRMKLVLNIE